MSNLKNFLTLRTISSKIALICLVDCIILVVLIFLFVSKSMLELEVNVVSERLDTDISYLECIIGDCKKQDWRVQDGTLYYGNVRIGDGTEEGANSSPFIEAEKRTGTYGFAAIKTGDEHLGVNMINGHQEGHYLRVAGSTKDAEGRSIIGSYLDKEIADQIDETGAFFGLANVQGHLIYSKYHAVKDRQGETIGFIVVGRDIHEVRNAATNAGRDIILLLMIIVFLAGVAVFVLAHQWTANISDIRNYLNRISQGELPEDKLELKTKDETGIVASCINDMVVSLKTSKRIGVELTLASDIQAHMLPCIFPPFPDAHEFDIYATMTPAKEVGGDFYDFFKLDDRRIAVVIADVSGKGIPSALVMVIAKTLIKNHMTYGLDPAEAFTTVNKMLCETNDSNMFVTAWMGVLDTESGKLTYVNAGHNPPLIKHADGTFEYLHSRPGFVLAGMEGVRYKKFELQLEPGSRLFLYTDGVTEAGNLKGDFYGEKKLQDFLNLHKDEAAMDLLGHLKEDIDAFSHEIEQSDDITMLMLDFNKFFEQTNISERVFPADDNSLEDANAFLEAELTKHDCTPKALMQLSVALEEIFVNISHYAYTGIKGIIRIGIAADEDSIHIRFVDSGVPFNPLEKEDPDITSSAEERDIGGLGIFITKKTVDDISYEYKNGQNILNLVKKIK